VWYDDGMADGLHPECRAPSPRRRRAAPVALLAALLLAGAACVSASDPVPPAETGAALPTLPDVIAVPVRNFARVDDGLYRGAQPDAAGFRALSELGVRTVVNLRRSHDDVPEDLPPGMQVVAIPMHAFVDSDPPSDEDVRRFFDVVLDPARRPVFVHCAQGKDRTGTMCALYRMEVQGWSNEDALAEMQRMGFHDHYSDLERFVREYRPRTGRPSLLHLK